MTDHVEELRREVKGLMGFMLRQGLADDTRLALEVRPGREGTLKLQSPYWAEAPKSITSVPYPDYYETIRLARSYDLRLLDGALIQLQYEFDAKRNLRRSVQRFLPAPDLLPYQTSPDLYLRDELYGDVVGSQVVTVPIRFDYDGRPGVVKECLHPASHLTLGQYPNCRIAVAGPVTPYFFFEFILRAFYGAGDLWFGDLLPDRIVNPSRSITQAERVVLHIGLDANDPSR